MVLVFTPKTGGKGHHLMTYCPGDISGQDHSSSLAAWFPGGQRAGQVSQGSEVGKGRAWGTGAPQGSLKKGLERPEESPWPGAGQRPVGLQEPPRWTSWRGVYTARGGTGDIFLRCPGREIRNLSGI